jgi:hypothetical protein
LNQVLNSRCRSCLVYISKKVLDNPVNFVFKDTAAFVPSIFSKRLRNPSLYTDYRSKMQSAMCKGLLFDTSVCKHQFGPAALIFQPPITTNDEWDILSVMFNHFSIEYELHHKVLCTTCTPLYHCNTLKESPIFLLTSKGSDVFQDLIHGRLSKNLRSHSFFFHRILIDGNFLVWPLELIQRHEKGSLPNEWKKWIHGLVKFMSFAKHSAKYVFAAVFFYLQHQLKTSKQDFLDLNYSTKQAEINAAQVALHSHVGIARWIVHQREQTGENSTYLLKRYGLIQTNNQKELFSTKSGDLRMALKEPEPHMKRFSVSKCGFFRPKTFN